MLLHFFGPLPIDASAEYIGSGQDVTQTVFHYATIILPRTNFKYTDVQGSS